MEKFELVPLLNGIMSLRCLEPRETFHPDIGPEAEAQILHVDQLKIVERSLGSSDFHLWDVGLGAGANVLTAIRSLQKNLASETRVVIQSFDKTTSPIKFALKHSKELGYLVGFENEISELLSKQSVQIGENITWNLHGEFVEQIAKSTLRAPDAIFYDPYSAAGNPEMWSLETFQSLHKKLDPKRLCLLSNYTASTYIRVSLLIAGFFVGYGCAVGKKEHTTIASNQREALEHPLDLEWLEMRVTASHSAAPIRAIPHQIAPISEEDFQTLLQHPQFDSY